MAIVQLFDREGKTKGSIGEENAAGDVLEMLVSLLVVVEGAISDDRQIPALDEGRFCLFFCDGDFRENDG